MTLTITITFSTVNVTITPTSSINAELIYYTVTISSSADPITSSILKGTCNFPFRQLLRNNFLQKLKITHPTQPLSEEYTITSLIVEVTLGGILIIVFLLATVIIMLIAGMAVCIERKVWYYLSR